MKFRDYLFAIFGGLFIGLSLLSPFVWSGKLSFVNNFVSDFYVEDFRRINKGNILSLVLIWVLLSIVAYLFAQTSKYFLNKYLRDRRNLEDRIVDSIMNKANFLASLLVVILSMSYAIQETFFTHLHYGALNQRLVIGMVFISLLINSYLDQRQINREYEIDIHLYLLVPLVLISNIIILVALVYNFMR